MLYGISIALLFAPYIVCRNNQIRGMDLNGSEILIQDTTEDINESHIIINLLKTSLLITACIIGFKGVANPIDLIFVIVSFDLTRYKYFNVQIDLIFKAILLFSLTLHLKKIIDLSPILNITLFLLLILGFIQVANDFKNSRLALKESLLIFPASLFLVILNYWI